MNMKVSCVVPIYNVEKYLEECLLSIINQTYKNIEIILINDGSKDNSLSICKKYLKKDKRIILIDKKNGGVSRARNDGIKKSSGEAICFIDSDDKLDKNYVKELVKALEKDGTNIAQCKIKEINDNDEIIGLYGYDKIKSISGRKLCVDLYNLKNMKIALANISIWNKIYRKSLFDNICFPEGKWGEDIYINSILLYSEEKVSLVDKYLYFYRKNMDGFTKSKYKKDKLTTFLSYEMILDFYKNRDKELYNLCTTHFLNESIWTYIKYREDIGKDDELNKIHENFKKHLLLLKEITLKNRIKYFVFKYFKNIYYYLMKYKYNN